MSSNEELNKEIHRIRVESKFLARSVLLEETGSKAYVKLTVLVCTGLLLAFILWASIMEVDEVAIADGVISPKGELVKIQHLFGGKVARLLVEEGEFVQKDQILIEIDPEVSELQLGELNVQHQTLKASAIRLRALIDNKSPKFPKEPKEYREIFQNQHELYERTKEQDESGKKIILKQIDQTRAEIRELQEERSKLKKNAALLEEEYKLRQGLVSKGLNSKISLITLERNLNEAKGSLVSAGPKMVRLKAKLEELQTRKEEYQQLRKNVYIENLARINSDLLAMKQKRAYLSSNLDYLKIRSTTAGYVHGLKVKAPGEVVTAGETLLQIVPADRELEAHLKIAAKDIGHLKTGQEVLLKFKTFNFRKYGGLDGELIGLSNSAFLNEQGESFYRGIVRFEAEKQKMLIKSTQIIPGMTVTADIKTGKKTVLEYLLRPLFKSTETVFYER